MKEWDKNLSDKRTVKGRTILIGQQDFEDMTIAVMEEDDHIRNCPMASDKNGNIFFIYEGIRVYVSKWLDRRYEKGAEAYG